MAQVPSNLIPISITNLPVPVTPASEDTLLVGVYNGVTYKIRAGDLLQVAGVPTSRQVIAGTSLTGGGPLSSNVTLSVAPKGIGTAQLADSGVTPGVYGDGTNVPQLTVDATGRVMAITEVPLSISGYVPTTRQVIAGDGLTGGGALSSNVTLAVNYGGTPLAGSGSGSAGAALTLSRSDHRHPAVDLADDAQVDNILGLQSGGTARSLTMQPGAVIWSGADGLYVGTAGTLGQVLVSGGTGAPTWGSMLILAPVAANSFFAGPTSGGVADPVFRAMVNADLPNSGVVANTYGSGTQVPVLVVNSKGVVTSASMTNVTPAWSNITATPTTIAGYGIVDGVTLTGAQALTNKTIDASLNTLSNIPNAALSFSSIAFTYAGGVTGSASVALGGTNALSLSNVPNASLANSSVTFNGVTVALGASGTITAANPQALTIGTGLSGTSYNGSSAVTIAIDSTVATLSGSQTLTNKTISGASNTLTNIGNASLTNSSLTIGTTTISLGATSLTLGGLTSVAVTQDPVSALDLATKQYVDGVAQGLNVKAAVLWSTTANIVLAGLTTQVGGEWTGLLTAGDRILVKNQTLPAENGIYAASATGWTRTADANAWSELVSAFVFIEDGATLADTGWVCTVNPGGTLGVTPVTWSQFSGAGTYTAGTGLTFTGSQFSLTAPVTAALGGSGQTSYTTGDMLYASGATALSKLALGTNGYVLTAGASAPQYVAQSSLAVGTATNLAGGAASQIPYQTGAGATTFLANGTAGQVLTSAGSGAPVWSGISGGTF
jgi:hypothetical protein